MIAILSGIVCGVCLAVNTQARIFVAARALFDQSGVDGVAMLEGNR